jgi:hypothetical protein
VIDKVGRGGLAEPNVPPQAETTAHRGGSPYLGFQYLGAIKPRETRMNPVPFRSGHSDLQPTRSGETKQPETEK